MAKHPYMQREKMPFEKVNELYPHKDLDCVGFDECVNL